MSSGLSLHPIATQTVRANTPRSKGAFAPAQSTEIYVVRADGLGLRQLTNADPSMGGATWSPDRLLRGECGELTYHKGVFFGPSGDIADRERDVATGTREILTSGPRRE